MDALKNSGMRNALPVQSNIQEACEELHIQRGKRSITRLNSSHQKQF